MNPNDLDILGEAVSRVSRHLARKKATASEAPEQPVEQKEAANALSELHNRQRRQEQSQAFERSVQDAGAAARAREQADAARRREEVSRDRALHPDQYSQWDSYQKNSSEKVAADESTSGLETQLVAALIRLNIAAYQNVGKVPNTLELSKASAYASKVLAQIRTERPEWVPQKTSSSNDRKC